MDDFLKIISSLNDETRIRILLFVAKHGKVCVCEIEASFKMSQSRLSRHLKILKDAGFLQKKREGKYIFYFLNTLDSFKSCLLENLMTRDIEIPHQITPCDIKR